MIVKVKTGFTKYRDAALPEKAIHIANSLTGNLNYPTPPVLPAAITLAANALELAIANTDGGGPLQTAIKNQKRKELIAILNEDALYVQQECDNDDTILLTSGYDMINQRSPVGILPKPQNFRVRNTEGSGQVKLSCVKIPSADSYMFQYAKSPVVTEDDWISEPRTRSSALLTGLESGIKYSFRVAGVGATMPMIWSDVVERFVQ